ncbi:MAG: acetyl-CoA C-acyltransferase, partial [Ilumatobacter sp.]
LDLFELNEAFAAVGLASIDELGVSADIVNVNGGAIALGHPIGMSGNRLALTLLHELKRRGGGIGAAGLCGGGGQGDAIILKTV